MIPNLQKSCILCGVSSDLNTAMGVTLEDETKTKVQVALCDGCAEECTPKIARAAYLKKQAQIDEVLARAKELGMDLSPTNSGMVIATQPAPAVAVAAPVPRPLPAGVVPVLEGDDVVSTAVLDRPVLSVGGAAQFGSGSVNVPAHISHDPNSIKGTNQALIAARNGKAKMQLVEGRGGQPLMIPALRQDGMGTTRLRVVKTGDKELQNRFKYIAGISRTPQGPSYRHGYDPEVAQERQCPICQGTCQVQNRGRVEVCPKCNGTGII